MRRRGSGGMPAEAVLVKGSDLLMEAEVWIWLLLLVLFVVAEGMTYGLYTIWFAGGALAAGLCAYFGGSLTVQLILFIGVSVVLLLLIRPVAVRFMDHEKTETNVNSMIGQTAVVTEKIDNLAQSGQVRINDIEWTARSEKDSLQIPEGAVVEIVEVKGVRLIVKPAAGSVTP